MFVVLVVDRAARAGSGLGLGETILVLGLRAVNALLEDGLGLVDLELGLEVVSVVGVSAAVGAATGIGELELLVDDLLTGSAPAMD